MLDMARLGQPLHISAEADSFVICMACETESELRVGGGESVRCWERRTRLALRLYPEVQFES